MKIIVLVLMILNSSFCFSAFKDCSNSENSKKEDPKNFAQKGKEKVSEDDELKNFLNQNANTRNLKEDDNEKLEKIKNEHVKCHGIYKQFYSDVAKNKSIAWLFSSFMDLNYILLLDINNTCPCFNQLREIMENILEHVDINAKDKAEKTPNENCEENNPREEKIRTQGFEKSSSNTQFEQNNKPEQTIDDFILVQNQDLIQFKVKSHDDCQISDLKGVHNSGYHAIKNLIMIAKFIRSKNIEELKNLLSDVFEINILQLRNSINIQNIKKKILKRIIHYVLFKQVCGELVEHASKPETEESFFLNFNNKWATVKKTGQWNAFWGKLDDDERNKYLSLLPYVASEVVKNIDLSKVNVTPSDELMDKINNAKKDYSGTSSHQTIIKYFPNLDKISLKYLPRKNCLIVRNDQGIELSRYRINDYLQTLENQTLIHCLKENEMMDLMKGKIDFNEFGLTQNFIQNLIIISSSAPVSRILTENFKESLEQFKQTENYTLYFLIGFSDRWITFVVEKSNGQTNFYGLDSSNSFIKENREAILVINEIKRSLSLSNHLQDSFQDSNINECEFVLNDLPHDITKIIAMLNDPKSSEKYRQIIYPVLLFGPSGTGKSTLAKIIAFKTGRKVRIVSGAELLDRYYGGTTEKIKNFFKEATDYQHPIVLFIDELDSLANIGKNETARIDACKTLNIELDKLLAQNLKGDYSVFFISATNKIQKLDKSTKSRFTLLNIPLPDKTKRFLIINKICSVKKIFLPKKIAKTLAGKTEGWSIRDIEKLLNYASSTAIENKKAFIGELDIEASFKNCSDIKNHEQVQRRKKKEKKSEKNNVNVSVSCPHRA